MLACSGCLQMFGITQHDPTGRSAAWKDPKKHETEVGARTPVYGMAPAVKPPAGTAFDPGCNAYDVPGMYVDVTAHAHAIKDLMPPEAAPRLSYDPALIAQGGPQKAEGTLCQLHQRWTGYVREMPERERRRYAFIMNCDWHRPKSLPERYRKNDPLLAIQADLAAFTREDVRHVMMTTTAAVTSNPSAWESHIETAKCTGASPGQATVAALAAHREKKRAAEEAEAAALAEHRRCQADPACVESKRQERLAEVKSTLCNEFAARDDLRAAAKQEWKYGSETGVVDVRYLGRIKDSLEIRDMKILEAATEYEELAGKKFSAKACR